MQREATDGGIIISCDFCGTDWDPYDMDQPRPMMEGHRGSVICLPCVKVALVEIAPGSDPYECTLCRKETLPADLPRWHSDGGAMPANLCKDCLNQAAGTFSKDPDIDWKRPR